MAIAAALDFLSHGAAGDVTAVITSDLNGEVVELGSPTELLAAGGAYARLVAAASD